MQFPEDPARSAFSAAERGSRIHDDPEGSRLI